MSTLKILASHVKGWGTFTLNLFYDLGATLKNRITLRAWIDKEGVDKIAKKLGVNVSTVRHWRRGHCLPKTDQMREIKKLSEGAVTYDAMIDNQPTEAKG